MEYMKISIPRSLAEKIKKLLPNTSYRSVSEFVIDATRRRLESLQKQVEVVEE